MRYQVKARNLAVQIAPHSQRDADFSSLMLKVSSTNYFNSV